MIDLQKIRPMIPSRPLAPQEQGQVILGLCRLGMPEAAAIYARGIGFPEVGDWIEDTAAGIRRQFPFPKGDQP